MIGAMSMYKIRETKKHSERGCNLKELPRDAESMNLGVFEIVIGD